MQSTIQAAIHDSFAITSGESTNIPLASTEKTHFIVYSNLDSVAVYTKMIIEPLNAESFRTLRAIGKFKKMRSVSFSQVYFTSRSSSSQSLKLF